MFGSFFPELEPKAHRRAASVKDPCVGCPHEAITCKIKPSLPERPILIVLGVSPSAEDEHQGKLFMGPSGEMLRDALRSAGFDPEHDVLYMNLTRCRPPQGNHDTDDHAKAEKHCRALLEIDLQRYRSLPILLLGTRPMHAVMGNTRRKIGGFRGLWIQGWERDCFVARHPAQILQLEDEEQRARLTAEFYSDLRRMADRILEREPASSVKVTTFASPFEAQDFLSWLARRSKPWAFDIEAYDGEQFPSRKEVSVDPCHPDFRLRGIAIATSATTGYYIDCKGWDDRITEVREMLSPAFESDAEKWTFNGQYDEEGLIYPGWIRRVRRTSDGMLAMIALDDGSIDSYRLEKAVVDVLGKPQYWNGMDKSRMRDTPLEIVAANAAGDACYTFELCDLLHGRLARGEYFS